MEKKQIIINNLLVTYYSKLNPTSDYNLIFLHGWRSKALVWNKIIEGLNYSSFALDFPGFGESQHPITSFYLKDFADTLYEFIQKLDLKNVILIGHSNGGAISIKYISENRSPIEKLVLIDSSGIRKTTSSKRAKNIIAKLVKPIFKIPILSPLRDKIYIAMGSEDYTAEPKLKETFINIISEDLTNSLDKINIPTLLIWGDKDVSTPIKDAELMKSKIPNSELKVIAGADHFSFNNKEQVVIDYLNSFIQ